MCGIVGIAAQSLEIADLNTKVTAMLQRLRHRGPDDEGQFFDGSAGIGLGHARLSILDLSPAGHQPMSTSDGRFTIAFNGEIYNFWELRKQLEAEGHTFRSRTDTEVILQLFQKYGSECVKKLEGMFAFAIWDCVEKSLFLARDPLGIKPLYIWQVGAQIAFASELRAVLEANLGKRVLDESALHGYLLFGSVQEPATLVKNVSTLPAGHWMKWYDGRSEIEVFWVPHQGFEGFQNGESGTSSCRLSPADAIKKSRSTLIESVRKHHVSDVPVSLFLSGGIDSNALLALSKTCGFDNLRTFSMTFDDAEFNEGDLASRSARHFHTDHHEWHLNDEEGRNLITAFLQAMDQPSNDGFNTYCVSKFAHDHGAKVVLSGLGGDELFGGYPSFHQIPQLRKVFRYASLCGTYPRRIAAAILMQSSSLKNLRLGAFLQGSGKTAEAYWAMRGFFLPGEVSQLISYYSGQETSRTDSYLQDIEVPAGLGPADEVSLLETTRYMRNQLLRDSDVMSMAWGLELRVPLVDQRLVDEIRLIPAYIRLAKGKQLLLDSVPEIPEWIRSQPKRGFRFPFDRWISQSWGKVFERLDGKIPFPLKTWYRRWSLFTLEHFLRENQIESSGGFSGNAIHYELNQA